VTVNLPQTVEQAYLAAAQREGVSVDALITQVLVSHVPETDSVIPAAARLELVEEKGVFVLRSGQPINPEVVDETLESIRHERDLLARGYF
jgi:hypothetical protein